jgi:hypothetical protein
LRDFNIWIAECLALLFDQASKQNIGDSEWREQDNWFEFAILTQKSRILFEFVI